MTVTDKRLKLGRFGFEVQYTLMVKPEFLVFDGESKKLGNRLDEAKCALTNPMPRGWFWVADPSSKRAYLNRKDVPSADFMPWFLTDHHEKYSKSIGYNSYWVYRECKHVCFQLELVSEPFADDYSQLQFLRDTRHIYRVNMAELLEKGIVRAYTPEQNQKFREQVSIEIDDERWPLRLDAMVKLSYIAAGLYLFTTYGKTVPIERSEIRTLLDCFAGDTSENTRELLRYDLFTNYRLLLEGYFSGIERGFSWEWLRKLLTSRAHTALLCTAFNNDICYYLVHAMVDLNFDEMNQICTRDLALYRKLGIDSLFLDMFAAMPQPHLHRYRMRRFPFLRDAMRHFCDLDQIEAFVRAAVLGGKPPVETISLPTFHLRKNLSPRCAYVELRHHFGLKYAQDNRYPAQYWPVRAREEELRVIFLSHLRNVAVDSKWLLEQAALVGQKFVEAVRRGEPIIRQRRLDQMYREFGPLIEEALNDKVSP
ncbi:MAG: hypothetical protein HN348_29395 [Proteobacteria bacterium]|jgi:hypothetical protein|nr:hypothetical protein [Pseudomonadota bacterium]